MLKLYGSGIMFGLLADADNLETDDHLFDLDEMGDDDGLN
jgi:hypothetical protein|tara:strand:+ start:6932 stop:7051 length:120 start_codon:yes stop_codon:yes gene_type:complete